MELHQLTIGQAREKLISKEISSQDLTKAVFDRVDAVEGKVDAYLYLCRDEAMEAAREADRALGQGETAPLCGIPLGIKDVMCTKGVPTTCGSKILGNFVPPYDGTVISNLKKAGAVIVGKTNMDEFAMGSSTENSAFKTTKNPWDLTRTPGGSSGGSAAAAAAGMCLGSLGSDTGGSIRQPASHCGVVGLKPTYGRVSRFGLVAYASSLDQIGPFTRSVEDAALMLQAIAGYDASDSTSVNRPVPDYQAAIKHDVKGMRVGLPKEFFEEGGLSPDVKNAVDQAIKTMEGQGVDVVAVSLPHAKYSVAVYYVIAPAEASSNLARYDGVKYGLREQRDSLIDMYHATRSAGFGPEVQRRIIIGTYALSAGYYDAYYGKASQVRTLIMDDYKKAFEQCDAVISPVAPTPAFKLGEKTDDPLTMYLSDIFTLSANLAGVCGLSVPCGFSSDGLPIGLQLQGSHFEEEKILRLAHHFEQATEFHNKRPEI
ncbi:MAG: Asp-tRNA(Asn)/Glu-tRNA(Gln) amidotransferase subunit GatA [Desulfatibacillum sp.]|nr:Asp-tRNA(Asn)/Glu-tRNA(Gln) amidotransferase subunit GatA [Desulfatibacillum sp.]